MVLGPEGVFFSQQANRLNRNQEKILKLTCQVFQYYGTFSRSLLTLLGGVIFGGNLKPSKNP